MSKLVHVFFILILFPLYLNAQFLEDKVKPPKIHDFASSLQFLASPGLEGRETGTQGAALAADYIASIMQNIGLRPFYQGIRSDLKLSDYFQPFKLIRVNTVKSAIDISLVKNPEQQLHLLQYNDYKVNNVFRSLTKESDLVFAGYGIVDPDLGYNDYAGKDVKGKIVLVMEGYPGQRDSTSIAWKKFKTASDNDIFDLDYKCVVARKQGATAIITINKGFLAAKPGQQLQKSNTSAKDEIYTKAEYTFPANNIESIVSCFRLNFAGSDKLASLLGIDFPKTEQEIAEQLSFKSVELNADINLTTSTAIDTITVNNVIGVLPGKDTSQTVILGAHYDHLGKRGNTVYYGADDNASGVAGLLALAEMWTGSHINPPCNILFASWIAEEKGLIGSEYFAGSLNSPQQVKLYINMDMISRSVSEDTAACQLSIGTCTPDEYLRELARSINSTLVKPFTLDLWDVTGHTGSDYASFTAKNIPVMTYNTGLHNDYHTPRDIPGSADLVKMGNVLKVVNGCLNCFIEEINANAAH